ncbi:hypothetical protein ID867_06290 [Streptomyces parvulus]|nr:hypothetical protein [Streptomyces parvulus]
MNKNIRRSLVITAGVTGAWALGSAVASADELPPPGVRPRRRDRHGRRPAVTRPTPLPPPPSPPRSPTPASRRTWPGLGRGLGHGPASASASDAVPALDTAPVPDAAPVTEATTGDIDYLFGPLSAFAPDLDRTGTAVQASTQESVRETTDAVTPPVAGQAVSGAVPIVEAAVADARPYAAGLAGEATGDTRDAVLPPVANTAVDGAVRVAGQAVRDAGTLADGSWATCVPSRTGSSGPCRRSRRA